MERTECRTEQLVFQGIGGRKVVAAFDGGRLSSDGGLLLLREVEERTGMLRRFARCFVDHRDPELIEHTVEELVAQRVLRAGVRVRGPERPRRVARRPALAVAAGKRDPTGERRKRKRDRGHALAGKSTLNRLELTQAERREPSRYKKIVSWERRSTKLLVRVFLEAHRQPPREIVLDLDATDDPLHGHQEGRFFHGYYDELLLPAAVHLLRRAFLLAPGCARRDQDAAAGSGRGSGADRGADPAALAARCEIIVRADSGFCREELMAWCEENGVDYVFGLARNDACGGDRRPEMARGAQRARADRAAGAGVQGVPLPDDGRAGAASAGWSARPSTSRARPIRASS